MNTPAAVFICATLFSLSLSAANGDWRDDAPGVKHAVPIATLPKPGATPSRANGVTVAARPANALPRVPAGYTVSALTSGLDNPRVVRVAPNGDVFVAETRPGRIRAIRMAGGKLQDMQIFASGLDGPFGIAFYPAGKDPQWLYVANNNSVVRFPYRSGDLQARAAPQGVVKELSATKRMHSTRDLVFTRDGLRMLVSVGSGSNVAQDLPKKSAAELQAFEASAGLGAAWGNEERRADILAFDPEGKPEAKAFATGIRNCVGMAVQPDTGDVWCATNERDELGDDLVPDYVTRVREGAFYGWPWYYLGANPDPRLPGARPDLRDKVTVPDVLLQAHSAMLGVTFWRGDAYATSHGSWNRGTRTGYKVVRIPLRAGVPVANEYEDFLTGFVLDDQRVWGRPVGVAAAADGSLLVTDDGSGTLWRVAPQN
jgi:hypothetical protein